MADQVSWFMIERGWKVVARDGEDVGKVEEVIGDSTDDIFNGLAISTGLFGEPRYVPAERVAEIVDGEVRLDLDHTATERLGEYDQPPPSEEILPPDRRS